MPYFYAKNLKNSPLNTKELFMILSYLKHSHRAQRFGTKTFSITTIWPDFKVIKRLALACNPGFYCHYENIFCEVTITIIFIILEILCIDNFNVIRVREK